LALIVVDWPIVGDVFVALGVQTGTLPPPPPPPDTQVSVWFGGVPDRAKLVQAEPE
jgi:hypothetical protein